MTLSFQIDVLRQLDLARPLRLQAIECADGPRGQFDRVVRPSAWAILEYSPHVVLLLQCLRVDLGLRIRRTRVAGIRCAVQVGRDIELSLEVLRKYCSANQEHFVVAHAAQVCEALGFGLVTVARDAFRAAREKCNQKQT